MAIGLDWRAQVDFLERIEPAQRSRLLDGATRIPLPAGEVIEYATDELTGSVIEDGLVRGFQVAEDGREATIAYLYAGEWVGGLPALPPRPVVYVQPLVDTTVLRMDAQRLRLLRDSDSAVDRAIAIQAATVLARVVRVVTVRTLGTVMERVAFDLLERASAEQLRSGELEISSTQQELADSVGSAREVVGRALAELRAAGVVTVTPRRIRVERPVDLTRIVHGLVS